MSKLNRRLMTINEYVSYHCDNSYYLASVIQVDFGSKLRSFLNKNFKDENQYGLKIINIDNVRFQIILKTCKGINTFKLQHIIKFNHKRNSISVNRIIDNKKRESYYFYPNINNFFKTNDKVLALMVIDMGKGEFLTCR